VLAEDLRRRYQGKAGPIWHVDENSLAEASKADAWLQVFAAVPRWDL